MKKQKVTDYIRERYIGRKPSPRTIVRQIQSGELEGAKEGGLWYVHLTPTTTGDADADSILRELGI